MNTHDTTQIPMISYRPDIDGLRAIAVSIVIAYHAKFFGFSGGFVGVDVFFVISGYLITQMLTKELSMMGKISLVNFYSRRFLRLLPALLSMLLFTLTIWYFFFIGIPNDTNALIKSAQYAAFGFANLFFGKNTLGYFDNHTDLMPLLHTWSLGVEEQFYLVWPLMLALLFFFDKKNFKKTAPILITGICLFSFLSTEYYLQSGKINDAFYLPYFRAWELGAGALIALYHDHIFIFFRKRQKKYFSLESLMSVVGISAIAFASTYYNHDTLFPGMYALLPVFGTVFLIIGGLGGNHFIKNILSSPPLVKIGLLSYGWYLFHWPLLSFLNVWYLGDLPPLELRISSVIVSLILSALSLKFFEAPIRHGVFFQKRNPYLIIFIGFVCALFVVQISKEIKQVEKRFVMNEIEFIERVKEYPKILSDCSDNISNIHQSLCTVNFAKEGQEASFNLVMWGDSHSASYFPMILNYSKEKNGTATLYTKSSSPAFKQNSNIHKYSIKTKYTENIVEFHQAAIGAIQKMTQQEKVKTSVILAARWAYYTGQQPLTVGDGPFYFSQKQTTEESLKLLKSVLNETLIDLINHNVHRIMIILPFPEFRYDMLPCYFRSPSRCQALKSDNQKYRKHVVDMLVSLSREYRNVKVVDPIDFFCDEMFCPQIRFMDGQMSPVVFDNNHPTGVAVRYFGENIQNELNWLSGHSP